MKKQKFNYNRIIIAGCSGAGKSTLAVEMGKRFRLPVVHLDKIWWLAGWKHRTEEEFDVLLQKELDKKSWIIEGDYNRTFSRRLERADFCVYLDYPLNLCLQSVYERFRKYEGKSRPDITEGCNEQVDCEFENWIKAYRENVRPKMLSALKTSNVPHIVLSSREETETWLNGFN